LKIGLYMEHGVGDGVGGAELMMAQLASAWSSVHDVELVHHRPPLTRERLASRSDDDFRDVRIRCVPREPEPPALSNPIQRYRAARDWHRVVSEGYDLFVNCTHWVPSFCHARAGALLVLFPFYVRPTELAGMRELPLWKRLRHRGYYDYEWRRRVATYKHRFAISEYARDWTRKRWGLDCEVVYPPVDVDLACAPKENLILSVGRFSTMAHTKKQLEMMRAFRALPESGDEWAYASVGGLNSREENHVYFESVRALAAGCSARVDANLDRKTLKSLFGRARIFWHATGLNDDTEAHPELAEHFGIATVEAMAAGCVPVVVNKGGQPEIVRHGETGFVWNTLDELQAYTQRLMQDDALWQRMSSAARLRAKSFARDRFIQQLSTACGVAGAATEQSMSPIVAPANGV
jgi:glycosyltransferase involved in cell wall biosynthesis